jgi:hypothetical protein
MKPPSHHPFHFRYEHAEEARKHEKEARERAEKELAELKAQQK